MAESEGGFVSVFDQVFSSLQGIPDATHVKATTIRTVTPVREQAQTWIVQTARHREKGDTVFIEYMGPDGTMRLALPPRVPAVIARQRDALTAKSRKLAGRERAAADKAAGIVPGFMRGKRGAR